MENATALLYQQKSTEPVEVQVLVFHGAVHIYQGPDLSLLLQTPLSIITHTVSGNRHFFYLDPKATHYLELTREHPLAALLERQVAESKWSWWQRHVKKRTVHILGFLLLLLAGFYFGLMALVPWLGNRLVSRGQEIQLGEQLKTAMLEEAGQQGEMPDTAATRILQDFANAMELSPYYPIKITVLKSRTVNAFALPGGGVVVYTGLLHKVKTPEALAALLAHECTHVNERHSLRSLLRSAASGIVVSVLFGDAGGIAAGLVNQAESLNSLRYSRSLEEEADRKGMDLMLQNGIGLEGMTGLLKTLQTTEGGTADRLSFLSTHPLTEERIKEAERYRRAHFQTVQLRKDLDEIFDELKQW